MEFLAAKILGPLLMPSRLLVVAFALGLLLWLIGARRLGRSLVVLAAVVLVVLSVLPVGTLALRPLETRFPSPDLTAPPDGIIVLGGAVDATASVRQGQPTINASAERIVAFVDLARRYPAASLIYTGGTGSVRFPELREADIARQVVAGMGLDPDRVTWDSAARTTRENAVEAIDLANPTENETWLLVTSAWHMPRAMASFRAAGFEVVAYPVDFRSGGDLTFDLDPAERLLSLDVAAHEWLGLAWYRLNGWTDTLLPQP